MSDEQRIAEVDKLDNADVVEFEDIGETVVYPAKLFEAMKSLA
jgi:hypothetical protein